MSALPDPVVRTFRIPRDLYERLGSVRGLESVQSEVVRRLEASFPKTIPLTVAETNQLVDTKFVLGGVRDVGPDR